METNDDLAIRIELALAQAKHIQRDSRNNVQQLASLRDAFADVVTSTETNDLQPNRAQGEDHDYTSITQEDR